MFSEKDLKRAIGEIIGTNYGECQCHESTMRIAAEVIRGELKKIEGCELCKTNKRNCNNCTHGTTVLCNKEHCENWSLHELDNFCRRCGKKQEG